MAELATAGFAVPRWLASNSAAAVRAFTRDVGGRALCRPLSGLRTRVQRVDEALVARLQAGAGPILVQEDVEGVDVHVHVVGRAAFACQVTSDVQEEALRPGAGPVSIPGPLGRLCCDFAVSSGLVLAAFAFRVTPDGRWLCHELDPAPAFMSCEPASSLPIGSALLDALTASWRAALRAEDIAGLCARAV